MPVTETQFSFLSSEVAGPKTAAIIVAAGESSRMGTPKPFLTVFGIPVIIRALSAFELCRRVHQIILVARSQDIPELQKLLEQFPVSKLTDITEGGDSRAESVQKGVTLCNADTRIIAIHDGARPLVSGRVIERVLDAAELYGAAACGVPVKDTIKSADAGGKITGTPDRGSLWAIQTPQAFSLEPYRRAAELAGDSLAGFTDDCAVMEKAGHEVYIVRGDYRNLKITTPEDLVIAEALCRTWEEEA